jgi:hypothetical protein
MAAEDKPDVILITESWCNSEVQNSELEIRGYNLVTELRRDRQDTQHGLGGGLLTYTKSRMAVQENEKFKNNPFIQFTTFSIMARCPLHIALVYRTPNSGRQSLQHLCKLLENLDQNTIVIGDFNLPDVQWEAGAAGPKGQPLLESVIDNELAQLVNFTTHAKGNIL